MMNSKVKSLLMLCVLLFIPGVASANVGLPMIIFVIPAFGLSIIPIILIEAIYLGKSLSLSANAAIKTSTISNIISTIFGIPVTWILFLVFQLFQFLILGGVMLVIGDFSFNLDSKLFMLLAVPLQAAWLGPYESDLHWMIPVAGFVLLVPFFFMSWWVEYIVAKRILTEHPAQSIKVAVRNANIITYALLTCWPIGFWVLNNGSGQ